MSGYTLGGYHVGLRGRFADGSVLVETFLWSRRARVWQATGTYRTIRRHEVHKAGADWGDIRRAVDALPLLRFATDGDAAAAAAISPLPSASPSGAANHAHEQRERHPGARLHAHYAIKED